MKYLIITILTLISFQINAQWVADTSFATKLLSLELRFWKSTNDSTKLAVLSDKANIYKSLRMYEQALMELERAEKYCIDQRTITLIRYEEMLNYFLSNKYSYSGDIVISLPEIEEIHKKQEYYLMKLQSLNEAEKWEQCKQELLLLCSNSDSSKIKLIQQLPVIYNYKSPEDCKRLSAFLPGLGEIKAGYPLKGITSFLIQSGLIVFTGYNFYAGFYLTGTISGSIPFLKFYGGGKRLSERLAERHNEEEKKNLKKKYNQIINKVLP